MSKVHHANVDARLHGRRFVLLLNLFEWILGGGFGGYAVVVVVVSLRRRRRGRVRFRGLGPRGRIAIVQQEQTTGKESIPIQFLNGGPQELQSIQ